VGKLPDPEPRATPPQLADPLGPRLNGLPLILAGPVLRHVDATSVTVWLALRRPKQVTLQVFARDVAGVRFQSSASPTIKVGENLYLIAVTASTANPALVLAPGTIYTYNVQFAAVPGDADQKSGDLFANGFLTVDAGADAAGLVSYGGLGQPSFALAPNTVKGLRLLQGSCRKPHADSIDALATAHDLLAEPPGHAPQDAPALDPLLRPHQLFLTGDQIYADDVGNILLALLMDAAPVLLGVDELLPGLNKNGTDGTTARFGPENRQGRIQLVAKFSSTAAQSHLMSFGEYAAMYLFTLSNVLWPKVLPDYNEVFPGFPKTERVGESKVLTDFWAFAKDKAERPAQESFRLSLEKVRRALANIPTYMIFDDHDVTDDWFMNRSFCEDVVLSSSGTGSRLGTRIIQNAVTAYALFQSWGNTGNDATEPMATIAPAFTAWQASRFDATSQTLSDLSDRLGLPNGRLPLPTNRGDVVTLPISASSSSPPVRWSFSRRWAAHEVIVVDSRTRRGYARSERASPALIAEDEIPSQASVPLDPTLEDKVTFVVVPGPIMTVPAQEDLQRAVKNVKDAFAMDVEVWSFDQTSLETLLSTLATRGGRKRRIVLLSGDVHYGFAYRIQYWADKPLTDPTSPATAAMALMTSSALKNETDLPPTRTLHKTGFIALDKFDRRNNTRLLWKADPTKSKMTVGHSSTTDPKVTITARVDRKVAVIPSLDRAGEELILFRNEFVFDPKPDSILASALIHSSDTRTAAGTPINDKPTGLGLQVKLWGLALTQGKSVYFDSLRPGSELVGLNNLGLITFFETTDPQTGDTVLNARQELFWLPGDPSALYQQQIQKTLPVADARTRLDVPLTLDEKPTF